MSHKIHYVSLVILAKGALKFLCSTNDLHHRLAFPLHIAELCLFGFGAISTQFRGAERTSVATDLTFAGNIAAGELGAASFTFESTVRTFAGVASVVSIKGVARNAGISFRGNTDSISADESIRSTILSCYPSGRQTFASLGIAYGTPSGEGHVAIARRRTAISTGDFSTTIDFAAGVPAAHTLAVGATDLFLGCLLAFTVSRVAGLTYVSTRLLLTGIVGFTGDQGAIGFVFQAAVRTGAGVAPIAGVKECAGLAGTGGEFSSISIIRVGILAANNHEN
jgi:hypothetical protein